MTNVFILARHYLPVLSYTLLILSFFTVEHSLAATQDTSQSFEVYVSGEGEITVEPDIAVIHASLIREGKDSATLLDQVNQAMSAVLKQLRKAKIPPEDIHAGQLNIQQLWSYHNKQRQPRGYNAQRPVKVIVHKIDQYPLIIDTLSKAGVNIFNNVAFEFSQKKMLTEQAVELAIADAKHKAQHLGKGMGGTHCFPKKISLGQHHIPTPQLEMAAAVKVSDQGDAYNPGEQSIRATINATFSCSLEH